MKQRPRIYYNAEQRSLMCDRWQKGDSMHVIARLFDRGHSSVQRVLSEAGGIRPRQRSRSRLVALTCCAKEMRARQSPAARPLWSKVDSLDLEIDGSTLVGESTASTASGIKLEFDGLMLTDQDAVILPYNPGLPNPWEGADLQVRSAFFKNFVVEIDFDKEVIRLTEPESYAYRGAGEVIEMSPGIFGSRTVQASLKTHEDKSVSLSFLLDLGGIYDLYIPIGSDKDISLPPDAKLESLGIGGFGASTGHVGTVKEFRIGKYSLNNVRAAYVEVADGQDVYGNTMIGLPLFQRFKVTLDYFNERMILEPSSRFPTDY